MNRNPALFSAIDPYLIKVLGNTGVSDPYRTTDGRTQVYPGLVSGEGTGVFVTAGQSNGAGCNHVDAAYTPTNTAKNQTLNMFNGGVYQTLDPLLGGGKGPTSLGSWGGRLADKLITGSVFPRVVLLPTDVGGSAIADWQQGALYFDRLIVATMRAIAVGLPVTGYVWHQGEADNLAGTSQATYTAGLTNMIAAVRAFGTGFQAPWFIGKCSYHTGTTSSAVRAAQAAVVNGTDIFAGADTDGLTATNRQADNLHFNATGADAAASLWKTAIDAVF